MRESKNMNKGGCKVRQNIKNVAENVFHWVEEIFNIFKNLLWICLKMWTLLKTWWMCGFYFSSGEKGWEFGWTLTRYWIQIQFWHYVVFYVYYWFFIFIVFKSLCISWICCSFLFLMNCEKCYFINIIIIFCVIHNIQFMKKTILDGLSNLFF